MRVTRTKGRACKRYYYSKSDQLKIERNYKRVDKVDILDGLAKRWRIDGSLEGEVFYKNGKRNGLMKNWNEDGSREEWNYKEQNVKKHLSRFKIHLIMDNIGMA